MDIFLKIIEIFPKLFQLVNQRFPLNKASKLPNLVYPYKMEWNQTITRLCLTILITITCVHNIEGKKKLKLDFDYIGLAFQKKHSYMGHLAMIKKEWKVHLYV